jgi:hypothetical protein
MIKHFFYLDAAGPENVAWVVAFLKGTAFFGENQAVFPTF